jgi:phospholipase C
MDEGGGYYDSGYSQPIDFFGDGTRIPFLVIPPYTKKGWVDHTYHDHGSSLKFIEAIGTCARFCQKQGQPPQPDRRFQPLHPVQRSAPSAT